VDGHGPRFRIGPGFGPRAPAPVGAGARTGPGSPRGEPRRRYGRQRPRGCVRSGAVASRIPGTTRRSDRPPRPSGRSRWSADHPERLSRRGDRQESPRLAVRVTALTQAQPRGVVQRRPGAELRSMQGTDGMQGVTLRCAQCGRVWRPVHERLGVEGQHHTTVLFECLSSDFLLDKGSPSAARRIKQHHGIEVGRTTVLQHGEQRGAEAAEFIGRKLAEALNDSEARRGQPLRIAEAFVQLDSSSGKTVSKLVRPTVDDDTKVERTPVRGLVKVQRPVEGRQVKLRCAQAKGEASWADQAYIGEFDEAVVPLQGLAATRGWQDGTLAVMTSDGEPSIQEVGNGAFHPNFRFILDHPHAMTHLGDVPLHAAELLPWPKDEWLKYGPARLHQGAALKLVEEIREIATQLPHGKNQTKVENVAITLRNVPAPPTMMPSSNATGPSPAATSRAATAPSSIRSPSVALAGWWRTSTASSPTRVSDGRSTSAVSRMLRSCRARSRRMSIHQIDRLATARRTTPTCRRADQGAQAVPRAGGGCGRTSSWAGCSGCCCGSSAA